MDLTAEQAELIKELLEAEWRRAQKIAKSTTSVTRVRAAKYTSALCAETLKLVPSVQAQAGEPEAE